MVVRWRRPGVAVGNSPGSVGFLPLGRSNDHVKRFLRQILQRWLPRARARPGRPQGRPASALALDLSAARCGCGPAEPDGPARSTDFTRLITAAVEAAANGILFTDHRGVVRWVNPAFTEITGYTLEEMVGQTPRILKSGRQPGSYYKQMWDTILAGRVWHGELCNRHKLGHLYVEEQTIAPVSNDAGEITHFIGIKQDITRRKEHERTLERRNAELAVMATTVATITSSLEVDSVLASIVNSIPDLLPQAMGATVQLEDAAGRLVTRAVASSLGPPRTPMVFEPGRGVASLAHQGHTIVNVSDVGEDPRFVPADTPPTYRSLIAVPIRSGSRMLGVLCVESREKGAFREHEERLLSLFAGSAAIAINHAAEYEGRVQAERELARYSERLEAMVDQRTADLKAAQGRLLEQQRLEQEVVLAAQVQASLLPDHTPDLPGYEFAGVALAARYVSGDMYDWSGLTHEQCFMVLADIAGKGVPAAMLTSTARALLRDFAARKSPPGPALSSLNRFLYDDLTRAGMFVTVAAANLDQRTAAVDYASAGHTEVLWYRTMKGLCEKLPATGPPIGVLPSYAIEEHRIFLRPGDVLVLYSDGVTEAESEKGEFFGTDRLIELLRRNTSLSAAALAQSIVDAVDTFAKGPRSDDLTIVVVKALPRTVSFRFAADLGHLEETLTLIRAVGGAYEPEFAYDLELAACEIVTNIIQHAYPSARGELRGEVHLEPDRVQVDLYDDGLPFDLSTLPAKDRPQASERGHGVPIVRQLMDEVAYSRGTSAGNHWRFVKTVRREVAADGQ